MKLALFGSGEFTPAVDQIDAYLIETFKPRNLAVLPTAAGAEKDVLKWVDMAQAHYAKFEIPVIPVPILNRADASDPNLVDRLAEVDWIFFSGGQPGYLLEVLSGSLLEQMILKRVGEGVLLAGSSAGSMVMGSHILAHPFKAMFGNDDENWQPALGLVKYSIIPHFNRWKGGSFIFDRASAEIRNAWMGIDEDTALVMDDATETVHGAGRVEIHEAGEIRSRVASS